MYFHHEDFICFSYCKTITHSCEYENTGDFVYIFVIYAHKLHCLETNFKMTEKL